MHPIQNYLLMHQNDTAFIVLQNIYENEKDKLLRTIIKILESISQGINMQFKYTNNSM